MSLEYAILGFLNYQPYSGYDLKKIFDTSIRHFWPADQSQIYRTLARLTDRGWAEMEKIAQEDRPDRKVYHITPAGRDELRRWISGPPPMGEPRSAPLIQVFFSGQLSDEEILAKFEGYAVIMRAILAQYEQVPGQIAPFQDEVASPREHFFWMLTLENGIRGMRANLEWAESVIERIRQGQVPDR
ncbi:MAG: PadR family transcriptional regulator [Chloroflexi bacterium]|jgi:DNA-binding PadR family transcriptional regulator|nr:PadR family transcriptional regulator [Anaerolineaceae bacterium]NMB88415.1 PadR family transcriptional regulator [Chloroflexota bacterium]